MASANITALTNLATMQPSMLMYAGLSPFGVTDDRKITASALLTTISPLSAGVQAVTVTAAAVPTVPTVSFNHAANNSRIQFDPSNAGNITDTFDMLSVYSEAAQPASIGAWNASATGISQWFLYAGATGFDFLRGICVGPGNANTTLLDVPNSGVLMTSNTTSGGMFLVADVAAPIIFATGGHAFSNEKGRFDAAGLTLGHVSTITGALNLANAASAFLTTITAGNATAARTYVWPTNFGSAGDVLTDAAGDGVLSWAAGGGGGGASSSGCTVTNSSGQSIADSANVALTFDTEVVDTDAYHSGSGSAMTVPTTGFYSVSASADFGANSTGARFMWFFINGSGIRYGWNSSAAPVVLEAAATVFMNAGDFIECIVAQTSGSPLSLSTGGSLTNYQISRLSSPTGGGGTAPQVRAFNSANISISDNTDTFITLNSERFDTDGMHFSSAANLTGTVSKNGTTAVTGAGTSFTTELSVGQVIMIPGGGGNERRVVTAIADNTNLTVNTAFANTAAAQVGVRQNSCLVARTAGTYQITACIEYAGNGGGIRAVTILLNANTPITGTKLIENVVPPAGSIVTSINVTTLNQLAQWDFVDIRVFQNSGGPLNVNAEADFSPDFMMIKVSDS